MVESVNIFFLDKDPKLAAQYHVDDHFKMILESGQLLSTTIRLNLGTATKVTAPNGKTKVVYLLEGETYTWKKRTVKGVVKYDFQGSSGLYVQTHVNHPCAVWTRKCFANFKWVYDLMIELDRERRFRKNTAIEHKTAVQMYEAKVIYLASEIFNVGSHTITPPALAMPDNCKISSDPVECYREYYRKEKQALHQWTNREVPFWL
jgi:hypothetical protein